MKRIRFNLKLKKKYNLYISCIFCFNESEEAGWLGPVGKVSVIRMKFLVVNKEEYKGRDLEHGEYSQDHQTVQSDEFEIRGPPEIHEETVLHTDYHVVHGVLHPARAVLQVDNVEDEDGGHDDVEDELRHWAPHSVSGAAEV